MTKNVKADLQACRRRSTESKSLSGARQGLSVEEIAERLHNTPEQVQSWIAEIPAEFRNRRVR